MVLWVLCAAYLATMAGIVVAVAAGGAVDKVAGPVMVVLGIVAVVYSTRVARDPRLDVSLRRFWRLVTVALGLALATPVLFLFVTGAAPFPQPGDGAHLLFVLILFLALLSYPVRAATRRERWKALLDAATVALGASMVLWYIVIGPALVREGASVRLVLAASAYPVVDLLTLFAFARVLMRGTERATRRPLLLLGTGVFPLFVGDVYLGFTQAQTIAVARTPWQFACWLTMHLLLACGAADQWQRLASGDDRGTRHGRLATNLPYIAIGVGYLLMGAASVREGQIYPWSGLVVGSMGITGVVVVRQMLAQNESDEAAATDALTGLANRARLHRELAVSLPRADRSGRAVGVLLIDLNGFKPINDTLGHQAGDQLLVSVAGALRRSVRGDDLAGRLGGDEFAVVLRSVGGPDEAVAVARRITEALAEPIVIAGEPVRASASIGVAVSNSGATPDEVLHRADVAMYQAKRAKAAWTLWRDDLETASASHERSAREHPTRLP
ncbi:GGDEF domain-containing protein [Actinoplanes sp. LDG1-06]|uniref:GGDEF domain-containing protein n=1 Tax=Paractinoplanes ovalisporus TaxID=2810368 RepID=A0ABS2AT85_9ACTN|nr:GGDEF domain-containing protein [Actinoplanes ovalisporus]MBM2623087.1 GGDEF domain-containing protein [Actinoplanes ovalisporus]